MDSVTVSINIITYGIPDFVEYTLSSLIKAGVPKGIPIRLFEDKHLDYKIAGDMSSKYKKLCDKYGVEYYRTPVWGCCQGTAQYATIRSPEDWIILLGDDVLIKKGAPESWIDRIINKYDKSSAGLIGLSWWESSDLIRKGIINDRKDILQEGFLDNVIDNPSWEIPEKLYINVHGSGFAMRRKMWEEVGGFSQNTWVWDEDISFRCWMFSRYNIFTAPGPSMIHYGGQSTQTISSNDTVELNNPRSLAVRATFGNGAAWERSWGYDKSVTSRILYMVMNEAAKNGMTLDVCELRNKPMADKIKDWRKASELYEKLTGLWFRTNDIETLGV